MRDLQDAKYVLKPDRSPEYVAFLARLLQPDVGHRYTAAEALMDFAKEHNPSQRVTTTDDVAQALIRLSVDDSNWLTGNTINVDGGEDIVVV